MAVDVTIALLGPLHVRGEAGELTVAGARVRRLLVRLAVDVGGVVTSDQLIDAVWGDDPPAKAGNALQALVLRLRRHLGGVVASDPAGYRLDLPADAVDAHRFETLATAGRQQLRTAPAEAAATLRAALGLWRGPALADVADAPFAAPVVARLDARRLEALEDRIEADLAVGGAPGLVPELEELVLAHPLREHLHGQLMRALAAAGRQGEALDVYQRVRARLADELGIDPSAELQAVHVAVLNGDVPRPPAAPATARDAAPAPPPEGNLPAPLTSFVGRDEDVARLVEELRGSRLVTLTGPGGAGKTRLAIEAAGQLRPLAPDGIWLVELAAVGPEELAPAVLAVLGGRAAALVPRSSRTLGTRERVAEAIGHRRVLLLVDNCEHVVAAAAELVGWLLPRCAGLRVLATSREPLGVDGEVLHPLGPLPLPPPDADVDAARESPAVRLLTDRAAARRPGFVVDSATVGSVVRICRALDGLPLAIELAAARLSALTADEVADRLDDRLRLLDHGGVRRAARHQTLRAVMDWSWDLLDPPSQLLLRRLSTFAGATTLGRIEQVCAADGALAAGDVLDLLAGLVDRSLVVTRADERTGQTRYGLLETVRAYAADRLDAAGETAALRRAHAEVYLAVAEARDRQLRGHDQLDALHDLSQERDNLHAALRSATELGDGELALRLAAALGWFWCLRCERAEALEWIDRALAVAGPGPPLLRAHALAVQVLALATGDPVGLPELARRVDEAIRLVAAAERAGAASPHADHPTVVLLPLMAGLLRGQEAEALPVADDLAGTHPDPWVRAAARLMAGLLLVNAGAAAEAHRHLRDAEARFAAIGDRWGVAQAVAGWAMALSGAVDAEEEMAALERARAAFAELGDHADVAQLTVRLALGHAARGDRARARAELDVAEELAERVGAEEQRRWARLAHAALARWEGDVAASRAWLTPVREAFDRDGVTPDQLHAFTLTSLGLTELAAGEAAAAARHADRALAIALATRDLPVVANAVELRAAVRLAQGDPVEAARLLGTATLLRGVDDRHNPDLVRLRTAAADALGDRRFEAAVAEGAGRSRDEVLAELAAAVTPAGGTPTATAGRTPR